MRTSRLFLILSLCMIVLAGPSAYGQSEQSGRSSVERIQAASATQRDVSFKAKDGWGIHGTLTVPAGHEAGQKWPAALLIHSASHTQIVWGVYPGWVKIQDSLVTLRIDWRGCGKSRGPIPFAAFTPAQREKVVLDVKAALDFLASQPEVESSQIGVAAEGFSVDPAIRAALADPRVNVLVVISGRLTEKALKLIAAHPSKSMLFVVSNEDKQSFDSFTQAYGLTNRSDSELWVQDGLGIGLAMGSMWRNKYPDKPVEEAIDFKIGAWFVKTLGSGGQLQEIQLQTEDGWILYANLGLPGGLSDEQRTPGVILLPTALSDRASYYNLERAFLKNGMAVLNLDWRSIGQSTNKGTLLQMSAEKMDAALSDVLDGYKYLLSQKGIDPDRIGVLGAAFGAKLAMSAAREVPHLKAIAMLTPVVKPHELAGDCQEAAALTQPVLLVTGDAFGASSKEFVKCVARDSRNRILTYPGGILGYSLFEVDEALELTLVQWFKEQLNEMESKGRRTK